MEWNGRIRIWSGMEGLDFWDRLAKLIMYFQERRRVRYQGLVGGSSLPFQHSDGRGRTNNSSEKYINICLISHEMI